ncbi:SNF2 family N-terminal domain-containing protein [Phlebopus sp. FC_14]|nr:SNF2 family N-terminal domain-containing protein [Phlebopus sp. FC_14]
MDKNVNSTIVQTEHIRRKASYYWPSDGWHQGGMQEFRPALNITTLISIILCATNEEGMQGKEKEYDLQSHYRARYKRRRSLSPPSRRDKRRRLHEGDPNVNSRSSSAGEELEEEGNLDHKQVYPAFWESLSEEAREPRFREDASFLPIYEYSVDLQYTRSMESIENVEDYLDDRAAKRLGWLREEEELLELIETRRQDASLPLDVNLGKFWMTRYRDRLLALSGKPETPPNLFPETIKNLSERWLLLLPHMPWPDGISVDDLELYDLQSSPMHNNFLVACAVLQLHNLARVDTNLRLRILPKDNSNLTDKLPFRLQANIIISLPVPDIYYPLESRLSQRKLNELDGLQRRLIACASGTALGRHLVPNYQENGDASIPFFLNVLRPAPPLPEGVTYESLQPDGLIPALLPFQRRSVSWMLEREGKRLTSDGTVTPLVQMPGEDSTTLPLFWERIVIGGQIHFYSRLTGTVSRNPPGPDTALGGILAEEPGLGKTLECIALILLNPAPARNPSNERWDPEAELHVKEIKTTLIVTPPALATQWVDELAAHAPDLKVLVYDGWTKVRVPITQADVQLEQEKRPSSRKVKHKNNKSRISSDEDDPMNGHSSNSCNAASYARDADGKILDWCSYVNQFDVCVTTYNVLRSDLTVARAPPRRPRRLDVEYSNLERPRSPLVMVEWYRVIMDEVQMMGAGQLEEMVSLVPRLSSFAVSGTPARAQVSDLIRVLRFLRVDNLVAPIRIWNRLLKHAFKDLFSDLFKHYAVRTLKSSIKDELTIPQQRRYLVGIELGRVERHVYDQALEDALVELGLDARGVAAYDGWQVDAGLLRSILRKLRGICTHPQVGQLQKQGDKSGSLKSIGEVLETMKDQNWRNLMDDRKAKIQAMVRLAQLQQHRAQDRDRYQRALDYLLTAEKEATEMIGEIRTAIANHHQKGEDLKKQAQTLRESRKQNLFETKAAEKGKGKDAERQSTPLTETDDEDDIEDRGLPKTLAGEEHRNKRATLQQRLREALIVLHRVRFLQGDVYHMLGSSHANNEDAAYADAETMRKDLLKSTEDVVAKGMLDVQADATARGVDEHSLQIPLPFLDKGGIRSSDLFDEANEIIEDSLNEQAALIWQWRTKVVTLITQKLTNSGEQADGEEYARTLDTQGEAEVFLQAYASLLADRREAIVAERTLLAAHEGREKKKRGTKTALAAARRDPEDNLEVLGDVDVQPQHELLHKELKDERKDLQTFGRALKSVMVDLSAVAARIAKDTDPEKIIAKNGVASLRALIASQLGLMDKLDADLVKLRKVFNDRIVYFRQLQEISDTVAEVGWEGTLDDAIQETEDDRADLGDKINTGRARHRYLEYLAKNKEDGVADDKDELCVLCRCDFTRGFVTHCAHVFCEECMKAWLRRREAKTCPVCRVAINPNELQRFNTMAGQPPSKPVLVNNELVPTSRREIQYNMIDPSLFSDIQMIESNGSYGSKIQTLVRHLLYIQLVEPGAKSIVFSAWADSLTIIAHALYANNIPYLRLDQTRGKGGGGAAKRFRTDPGLQVLLMHGERDNAGLNVTCASRVFLVESVVNHGFEMQAIARIDRMGQTLATEVFCYYAEDTVEKNILDLAARQGLSIYTKDNSAGSVNVTSFATDGQKKLVDPPKKGSKKDQQAQKGDFIFKVDDMLAILFPHMFEEIQFLLPPDPDGPLNHSSTSEINSGIGPVPVNTEAGPSRLAS